jgi:transposase
MIHAVVDALGNPVALSLMPGQAADISQAGPLLEALEPEAVIADKGYSSDRRVETPEARGIAPLTPPKADRKEPPAGDFALYCERNLVERFLNRIKHHRAIATRFDRLASTFLADVLLVRVLLWLN